MKKHGDAKEVAEVCECTVRHVNKTWKKYQEGGIQAIKAVKMGCPKGLRKRLTSEQEVSIKKQIANKTPKQAGLSGYLWGRAEVCELIKQQYGISIPLTTMGRYLSRWNFTYQRPKKKITDKTKKQ
jgi:transposase